MAEEITTQEKTQNEATQEATSPSSNQTETNQTQPLPIEEWKLELFKKLMNGQFGNDNAKYVQIDAENVYMNSSAYGSSRKHLLEKRWDDILCHQIENDKQYQQKITYEMDELEPLLATLLIWYFEINTPPAPPNPVSGDTAPDELGALDDHPF